jgi:cytoskeletal protein RodZ
LEHQRNKIRELGFLLREARSQNSLSLEEAAAQTLIRVGLLSAIETGDLEELPELVYVQALIRQYANFLGLEGDRLAKSIPTNRLDLPRDRSWKLFLPMLTQLRPMHLYLIYLVLMGVAVNSLSAVVENSKRDTGAAINLPPIQETLATPTPNTIASPSPAPAKPSQPIVVSATFKSQSWIRVMADTKTLFEGVLEEGTQRTWTAQEKLSLRAGNAGAVVIAFNEDKPKLMGNPGEVQEVIFTPNAPPSGPAVKPVASPTINLPTSPTPNPSINPINNLINTPFNSPASSPDANQEENPQENRRGNQVINQTPIP